MASASGWGAARHRVEQGFTNRFLQNRPLQTRLPRAAKMAAEPQPRGFSGSDRRAFAAAVQPVFSQGLPKSTDPADRGRTDRAKRCAVGGVSSRDRDRDSASHSIGQDGTAGHSKARRRAISTDLAEAGTPEPER